MRVVSLAAGAAGMLCGSCIRDNRVASVLRGMGRDVLLLPTYTPLRSDERVVAADRVIFGGINVYLASRFSLARRLPRLVRAWLDSPGLLRLLTRGSAGTRPAELGRLTLDVLDADEGPLQDEVARTVDALRTLRPAVVNLPNLMFVGLGRALRAELKIPIVVTLSGEDIFLDALPPPWRQQAFARIAGLSDDVHAFIATSGYYADHAAAHFGLPRARIHVVPLGVRCDDPPSGADPPGPFTIGYLARVCPEKGLDQLVDALAELRAAGRQCRVVAAGYLGAADRRYLRAVLAGVRAHGLGDYFVYRGEISRAQKHELLRSLHAFSVPTRYREAKGLYVLEALAAGVAVVLPRHGSFPEVIEATSGGLLYDPSEPGALARSLARLMDDPPLRRQLSHAGSAGVARAYSEECMARATWDVYERVVAAAASPPGKA